MILEILLVLILLFGMSYLFGFWDYLSNKTNQSVSSTIGIVIGGFVFFVACSIGGIVGTYFALAYCHKWFGHIVFGG